MINSDSFNDVPIHHPDDDRFGINRFAEALATSIKQMEKPLGTTIAINGSWGSGKSSAVNLIKHHLSTNDEDNKIEIIDYKCWWFKGEEALTLSFLQELNSRLYKSLGKKAKQLIPKIGRTLLQGGPVIGGAVNMFTGGVGGLFADKTIKYMENFIARYFPEGESLEKLFGQLSEALNNLNKRYLVVIDDIDRLTPDEALMIFRLVKSVGQLPNIIYLLVFDRALAEKAVSEIYPSEGPHFLEKIIQAGFELPLPNKADLNEAALALIQEICRAFVDIEEKDRFLNCFYDVVSPYLNTPRDLTRIQNSLVVCWPAVKGEVNVADFILLEILRLFEPSMYYRIRSNKGRLCGYKRESNSDQKEHQSTLEALTKGVPDSKIATEALTRLFPRLEKVSYSSEFQYEWEASRRICTAKHFDTYFRMAVGEETLLAFEINEFIEKCDDESYVKKIFLEWLQIKRKNGRSKGSLLLEELNVNASRIDDSKVQPLISAIFSIADDIHIDDDIDKGFLALGSNPLRIYWLIKKLLLKKNFSLENRGEILLKACQNAQIGWLLDFVNAALSDYNPRDGEPPTPKEKYYVNKNDLDKLINITIERINKENSNGDIIKHPRLAKMLFYWKRIAESDEDVKNWFKDNMAEDGNMPLLARAFTSETRTQTIGINGTGSRIVKSQVNVATNSLQQICDLSLFKKRLEEAKTSGKLSEEEKNYIAQFLETWKNQDDES